MWRRIMTTKTNVIMSHRMVTCIGACIIILSDMSVGTATFLAPLSKGSNSICRTRKLRFGLGKQQRRLQERRLSYNNRRVENLVSSSLWLEKIRGEQEQEQAGGDDGAVLQQQSAGEFSNFWFTRTYKKDDERTRNKKRKKKNTFHPTLDLDGGPLPPDCYQIFGDPKYEPKPTCLLTQVINLSTFSSNEFEDPVEIVSKMQQLMDYGLTTFQLQQQQNDRRSDFQRWGEKEIFGRFYQDTPAFASQTCNLILPISTPPRDTETTVCRQSVRQLVFDSLHSMGGGVDAIDTIQLEYCNDSPYHLEMLDYLIDLQRDGFIRSIGTKNNMPVSIIQAAQNELFLSPTSNSCTGVLDSNQINCNLLDPNHYSTYNNDYYKNSKKNKNKYSTFSTTRTSSSSPAIFLSSPLAGGLLTNRHFHQQGDNNSDSIPTSHRKKRNKYHRFSEQKFNLAERQHIQSSLKVWGEQKNIILSTSSSLSSSIVPAELWNQYQEEVLETLSYIALKHRVSMESVALRWAMQLDDYCNSASADHTTTTTTVAANVGSVMLDSKQMLQDQQGPVVGRRLREVFRFELDEEDMECLWEISGQKTTATEEDYVDETYYNDYDYDDVDDNMDRTSFVPDFSNQKLWL